MVQRPTFFEQLEVPADERRLCDVREFTDRTCAALGFPGRTAASIRLAVDEACTNVVKHAYAQQQGVVRILATAQRGWLEIRVVDQGTPFDGRVDMPQLAHLVEQRRKGGLGVFLMHRLMDEVRYETTPAGNEWILRKRLPKPAATFTERMRLQYAARAAAALVAVTATAVAPLWVHEGRERERADLVTLRAHAFGLAEASRAVLVHRAELSPEQTHLFEAVHALGREEPRILAIDVVDKDGTIWAADRASATFTRYSEPAGLGRPDADGLRRAHERIEGRSVLHLAVPVRMGEAGALVGAVHLSVRQDDVDAVIRAARLRLLGGAIAVDVMALLLMAAALTAFLRPIQRLVDGVRGLGAGDAQLSEEGPAEISAIAAAFNDVQARYRTAHESAVEHEALQQDLQIAQEIQAAILPQFVPDVPGFEMARLYRPAGQVGGDYYDFLDAGDGLTGVVVADVAGKGVSGSLVMGMLRTALRMETHRNDNAGDVLARLNQFMAADLRKGMFVTMLYVVLDTRHRVVSYASAGHTPMILYRADGDETFCLSPRGLPVGLPGSDAATFERQLDVERLCLREGDMLLLYTDGVTEAMDASGEAFGEERLLAAVKQWGRESAEAFVQKLEEALAAFTGTAPASDDITLVAIKEKTAAPQIRSDVFDKLVRAIEGEGTPVADACRRYKVSPSTYYRFKQAVPQDGGAPQQLSVEKSAALRRLATARPELDSRELAALLQTPEWGGFEIAPTRLHAELRRQGLSRPGAGRGPELLAADPAAMQAPEAAAPAPAPQPGRLLEPVDEAFVEQGGMRVLLERAAADSPYVVLQVEGCVDSGSCDALERLLTAAVLARPGVVVDLQEVAYVSSRGWGLFAAAAQAARSRGAVALAGMRPQVREVYRMLGFEPIVPEFADRDAAARHLTAAPAAAPAAAACVPGAALQAVAARPAVVDFAAGDAGENWESLRLRIGHAGGGNDILLIALDGILDTVTAYHFEQALAARTFAAGSAVLVDLSRLEFVSSAGWGCLSAFAAEHRIRGGAVRLFGMSRSLARIYELLHLDAVLPSHDVLADALAACGATEVAVPARINVGIEPAPAPAAGTARAAAVAWPEAAALPPAFAVTQDAAQLELDGFRAAIEPYGTSGRAQRLVLEGAWGAGVCDELARWLARHACPGELLLVDARGMRAADPCGWSVLCRHTEDLAARGVAVRIVAPAARNAAPPEALGMRLHPSIVDALRAQQWRAGIMLESAPVDAGEFGKDAEVRREGWAAYTELLRQTYREDAL